MGYQDENTPLSNAQQQPQSQLPQGDQYQQPQFPPQGFYGYPPNFQHDPAGEFNPAYQGQPNAYPANQGSMQYDPQAYGVAPGYMVVPSHALYQPILQRRKDRLGSNGSMILGVLLGFFFPVFSLLLLCFAKKLRIKHGVCVGHSAYYILGTMGFFITASLYNSQITPYVCHDLDSCMGNIVNGTESEYWAPFVMACNNTSYDIIHNNNNNEDINDNSNGNAHEFWGIEQTKCYLPYQADTTNLGPQSYACASCACDLKRDDCKASQQISLFSWIAAPFTIICAVIALYAARYYRSRISEESMSIYRL